MSTVVKVEGRPRRTQTRLRHIKAKRAVWKKRVNAALTRIPRVSNVFGMNNIVLSGNCAKTAQNVHISTDSGVNVINYGLIVCTFKLADVVSYTEFTNLFDQYRIDKVQFRLIPYATGVLTGAAVSPAAGQPSVFVHSIVDYDDDNTLALSNAGVDAMRQYPNYRMSNLIKNGFKRTLKPKVLSSTYQTSLTTGYRPVSFKWADCAYPDIPAYGLKIMFESISGGAVTDIVCKAEVKFWLSFKNLR